MEGEEYEEVVQSGYDAMMKWFQHRKMKDKLQQRIPNYQVLIMLWTFKVIELLVGYLVHVFTSLSE